jgi:hypothetical protein
MWLWNWLLNWFSYERDVELEFLEELNQEIKNEESITKAD